MKKNKFLLLTSVLALVGTCGLVSCNQETPPPIEGGGEGGEGGDDSVNPPFVPQSEKLGEALKKDYSNMTVEYTTKYKVEGEVGVYETSNIELYYDGYLIVFDENQAAMGIDNPYLYYYYYNNEFLMHFNGDVSQGEKPSAWLSHGYNDVSLDPSLTSFTIESLLTNVSADDFTYNTGMNAFYLNESAMEKVSNNVFAFAWENKVIDQVLLTLNNEGYINAIHGYNSNDDDEAVIIKLDDFGTTTFIESRLPEKPNDENVMEYWEYKGYPQKDMNIYINELVTKNIEYVPTNLESYINSRQLVGEMHLNKEENVDTLDGTYINGDFKIVVAGNKLTLTHKEVSYELTLTQVENETNLYVAKDGLRKHQLSLRHNGRELVILTKYVESTKNELEVDKTTIVGANILPIDATKYGLTWKTSNSNVLSIDQNASGAIIKTGLQQFISHQVEVDTEVEVWCEAADVKEGSEKAVSNKIKFVVKAQPKIDKTDALHDLYFTKISTDTTLTNAPFEVFNTKQELVETYPNGLNGNRPYCIVKEDMNLYKYYNDDLGWLSCGKYENTELEMWDEVTMGQLQGHVGKASLYDISLGHSDTNLFTGSDEVLVLEPFNIEIQESGHAFPCFVELETQEEVKKISFDYGLLWKNNVSEVTKIKSALLEYSLDGVTYKTLDVTEEIKKEVSANALRRFEKTLEGGAKFVRFSLSSNQVGGTGVKFGIQNIVLH